METLDVMAAAKFNVLHWDLVGEGSWPLEQERLPELAQNGAYSAEEVYSKESVK